MNSFLPLLQSLQIKGTFKNAASSIAKSGPSHNDVETPHMLRHWCVILLGTHTELSVRIVTPHVPGNAKPMNMWTEAPSSERPQGGEGGGHTIGATGRAFSSSTFSKNSFIDNGPGENGTMVPWCHGAGIIVLGSKDQGSVVPYHNSTVAPW